MNNSIHVVAVLNPNNRSDFLASVNVLNSGHHIFVRNLAIQGILAVSLEDINSQFISSSGRSVESEFFCSANGARMVSRDNNLVVIMIALVVNGDYTHCMGGSFSESKHAETAQLSFCSNRNMRTQTALCPVSCFFAVNNLNRQCGIGFVLF